MSWLLLAIRIAATEPDEEAPPVPIDLRWDAPRECPDRAAVLAAMSELAGRRLAIDADAALAIDGRIEASPSGYVLRLAMRGPEGEEVRELEARACDELTDAGALVVATRLLAPATSSVPPPPSEEDREQASPSVPVDSAPPRVIAPAAEEGAPVPAGTPPERARRLPRFFADVLSGPAFGLAPRITAMLRGGIGLRWKLARVELYGVHAFPRSRTDGVFGVRASQSGGGALGCFTPSLARVEFPLCAGIQLTAARGEGTGTVVGNPQRGVLVVGLPLEAGAAFVPIRWLALRLLLGGIATVYRPGFHLRSGDERVGVWRPWPFGLYALAGLEFRVP